MNRIIKRISSHPHTSFAQPAALALSSDTYGYFRSDIVRGLSQPQKSIPSKYFYDDRGSELFDEICRTPEYYPTRTELGLLKTYAPEIAALAGPGANLIEFGSGANIKAGIVLAALETPAAYIPVDISAGTLMAEAAELSHRFPGLAVHPVCADFTQHFELPVNVEAGRCIGFFPGSTIGNFTPEEAALFMRQCAATLGPDGLFVVGVDLKKSKRLLDDAYNDAGGVTAAFNLNLLRRINRELNANFDLDAFTHCAHYNLIRGRVEMHLYSTSFQTVRVDGHMFSFVPGESIHTENSYKYSIGEFQTLARANGFMPRQIWVDNDRLFSLHCLQVTPSLN